MKFSKEFWNSIGGTFCEETKFYLKLFDIDYDCHHVYLSSDNLIGFSVGNTWQSEAINIGSFENEKTLVDFIQLMRNKNG